VKIKNESKPEKLEPDREDSEDMFFKLLNGENVLETIKTSRGEFEVKFPKQKDIERIGILTAQRRLGIPARAFDVEAENAMYKCAVLDVIVMSGPKWYDNAKNRNDNFSWRDMPDIDFIDEVYLKAHSFRQEIQEKIKLPEKEAVTQDEQEDIQNSLDDGIFQGVAGSNK